MIDIGALFSMSYLKKLGIVLNENVGSSADNKISQMTQRKVRTVTLSLSQSSLITTSTFSLADTPCDSAKLKLEGLAVVSENHATDCNKYPRFLSLQKFLKGGKFA